MGDTRLPLYAIFDKLGGGASITELTEDEVKGTLTHAARMPESDRRSITCEQGIASEQELLQYDITFVTITSGQWPHIRENVDLVRTALATAHRGQANAVRLRPRKS